MGVTATAFDDEAPGPAGDVALTPSIVTGADWLTGGTVILDGDGAILEIDPSIQAWLGLAASDLKGMSFWGLLEERCPAWSETLRDLQKEGPALRQVELSVLLEKDTQRAWYRLETARAPSATFVRLSSCLPKHCELPDPGSTWNLREEGAVQGMYVRLVRAETQLTKLAEQWPGLMFRQRPDLSFEWIGGRVESLTGRSEDEWKQQRDRFWDVIHEGDSAELQRQISITGQAHTPVTTTFRVRNLATGRLSHVLEHRTPIVSGVGLLLGYEGVWLDVTRQALAERLLTSAAWKETLAVLTMGLAHDFSNVMAGIHSLSESFLSQLEKDHAFHEGMSLIKKSSLQASQLVHRIVNLHLGKPGERNYHDLNQIVSELLELVRKVIPRRIEITTELSKEALPVYADAFELRQVVINLALNAADAMPERGHLVLRTARHVEEVPFAHRHGTVGRYPAASLTVQDNGSGIKPSHLGLIFDPFFTTKSGGKGSGLGLYNARLFAEKHQGMIAVESEERRGARFHVVLPEADFSETDPTPPTWPDRSSRCALLLYGPACALFDETAETLRTEGYHVAAGHTLERVANFMKAGDYRYDGVFVLTESTGVVLAPHVAGWRQANPAMKVILRPIGRNSDELEPALLKLVDLVVTSELSLRELLERVKTTLKG